ncbi:Glutamate synthase [NADPH] large chain [Candidatus Rhodobacter oscarellae]|uniref:Glutamate synthase [NADPH] large chain n=1 Tax=Candidatus Rhodobacter oscarellae TaxID=1675527 RepID=A0A0J9E6I8_9RHOB|nr:redoxin domain-containing protein [Candidatus Rhodobacter lobularis]KMW58385.1 Glutamate synthase [NADPH] large chain [Candidatus Rhodobacter lobularis]
MNTARPAVGAPLGPLTFAKLGGGEITVGAPGARWTMLVVYRGKHCPRCKRYLNKLSGMLDNWNEHMDVVVVSADPAEKAQADMDEFGWTFDLCYDLSEAQMRALGLYVSDPLSEAETDRRFAEPGTFAIRPSGELMLVDISNGPASRPDLDELLDGMIFNITKDRPARGLA